MIYITFVTCTIHLLCTGSEFIVLLIKKTFNSTRIVNHTI